MTFINPNEHKPPIKTQIKKNKSFIMKDVVKIGFQQKQTFILTKYNDLYMTKNDVQDVNKYQSICGNVKNFESCDTHTLILILN